MTLLIDIAVMVSLAGIVVATERLRRELREWRRELRDWRHELPVSGTRTVNE